MGPFCNQHPEIVPKTCFHDGKLKGTSNGK